VAALARFVAGITTAAALAWIAACAESPTRPAPQPGAPTVTCPPDQSVDAPDFQPVAVTFATPVAQGGSPPVPVTCNPASPGPFPAGATTVTCTATDTRGQTGTCRFTVTVRPPPTLRFTNFMAFGDSLTSGVTSGAVSLSLWQLMSVYATIDSYPAKLQPMLAARYQRQPINIDNDGVPGECVTDIGCVSTGTSRFRGDVMASKADVVLLMEGTNDINLGRSPDRVTEALRAMIIDARSQNKRLFLATIPPERSGSRRPNAGAIPTFNAMVKDLAQQQAVPLVDVYTPLAANLSLYIGNDDLHPTVLGYEVMAKTFYDAIVANLEVRSITTRQP
jgi:lysophospholipase L1-like esterase